MWSVFSPYSSSYTLDLEALQNVVAELLGKLFIDRDDQDLVAVVNMSIRVIRIHSYIILEIDTRCRDKLIYQITNVN